MVVKNPINEALFVRGNVVFGGNVGPLDFRDIFHVMIWNHPSETTFLFRGHGNPATGPRD